MQNLSVDADAREMSITASADRCRKSAFASERSIWFYITDPRSTENQSINRIGVAMLQEVARSNGGCCKIGEDGQTTRQGDL
jgi:hypothetical protein